MGTARSKQPAKAGQHKGKGVLWGQGRAWGCSTGLPALPAAASAPPAAEQLPSVHRRSQACLSQHPVLRTPCHTAASFSAGLTLSPCTNVHPQETVVDVPVSSMHALPKVSEMV